MRFHFRSREEAPGSGERKGKRKKGEKKESRGNKGARLPLPKSMKPTVGFITISGNEEKVKREEKARGRGGN